MYKDNIHRNHQVQQDNGVQSILPNLYNNRHLINQKYDFSVALIRLKFRNRYGQKSFLYFSTRLKIDNYQNNKNASLFNYTYT